MNTGGDKLVTTAASALPTNSKQSRCDRRKRQGPIAVMKSGSAVVPVYRMESGGRVRWVCGHVPGVRSGAFDFVPFCSPKRQIVSKVEDGFTLRKHRVLRKKQCAAAEVLAEQIVGIFVGRPEPN